MAGGGKLCAQILQLLLFRVVGRRQDTQISVNIAKNPCPDRKLNHTAAAGQGRRELQVMGMGVDSGHSAEQSFPQ
eukprot:6217266-Karenia_brevis.AAC.1